MPPLVEIGLTDLSKPGGAMVPSALPGMTPLQFGQSDLLYLATINMAVAREAMTGSSFE